jgi:hypothetical protein
MTRSILVLSLLLTTLLLPGRAEDSKLRTTENWRRESVLLPPSAPDKAPMVLSDYEIAHDEEVLLGIVAIYNDKLTPREVDYIEVYDVFGDLVLIAWFDRFGIFQVAIDNGLLREDYPAVEGILVLVTGGTPL